jgi:hypothetical protein
MFTVNFVDSIKFIYFLFAIFYSNLINIMYYHNLLILIHQFAIFNPFLKLIILIII